MNTFSLAILSILIFSVIFGLRRNLQSWVVSNRRTTPDSNDLKRMAPYPAQPIKGRERYRVMMDVRKLDNDNWLTVDKNYMDEHQIRSQLLSQKKRKVLQCLPESYEACVEALEEVVEFLCLRFPNVFSKKISGDETMVHNKMTDESFVFGGGNNAHIDPLEIAVRLPMEDLSILLKNQDDEYYLSVFFCQIARASLTSVQGSKRQSLPRGLDSGGTHRMDDIPASQPRTSMAPAGSHLCQQVSTPSQGNK